MHQFSSICLGFFMFLLCSACESEDTAYFGERFTRFQFEDVRLGDGVPLNLELSVYWQAVKPVEGTARPDSILRELLQARSTEAVQSVSNNFMDVDSVFSTQRKDYIMAIKEELEKVLPEPDLAIQEVVMLHIRFPQAFTAALEDIGLQEMRESQIRKQQEIALVQATANKEKAKADGEVAIAKAEADGRLQAIQARTENSRRKSEIARAETAAAVARTQAQAEVDRLRKIKEVEVEKQRGIEMIAVEKQREMDKVTIEQQLALAQLCEANPTYASFLVNRELAGNVEIAVLPTGTDANVFGGLLQSRLPGKAAGN